MPKRKIKIKEEIDTSTLSGRLMFIRGKVSQQKFAERLGISLASLNRYENGRHPDLGFIIRLIRDCNIDPSWLLLGEYGGRGVLTKRQNQLLEYYNACSDDAKKILEHTSSVFAEHEINRQKMSVNPDTSRESEPS